MHAGDCTTHVPRSLEGGNVQCGCIQPFRIHSALASTVRDCSSTFCSLCRSLCAWLSLDLDLVQRKSRQDRWISQDPIHQKQSGRWRINLISPGSSSSHSVEQLSLRFTPYTGRWLRSGGRSSGRGHRSILNWHPLHKKYNTESRYTRS